MWTEERLNEMLSTPSEALVQDMKRIKGDIMILGAGGKMGPTLCVLAKRASEAAGVKKRVIAVSRFTDPIATAYLREQGVECISCDLLDVAQLRALLEVENVIYMAGKKFGTNGNEWQTWAMNATLPVLVAEKFQRSNIVVFSSGNIYPLASVANGGSRECDPVGPIGEYPMSCLARERAFEFAAHRYGTKIFIYRLNFAVDLRYGVLFDMAQKILDGEPINLETPCLNCIWQGSANEIALRGLLHTENPPKVMNVTGPETLNIRATATELGEYLGKAPVFAGEEGTDAYLSNATRAMKIFGTPCVSAKTLIRWQAEWILDGGRSLGKPTHFEERKGSY